MEFDLEISNKLLEWTTSKGNLPSIVYFIFKHIFNTVFQGRIFYLSIN